MTLKVVWKHALPDEVNHLDLPRGANVLHVAAQHGVVQLWEIHDVGEAETERRTFRLAGTGHPFPASADGHLHHVGSLLTDGGTYVFHVFEELR